MKKETDMAEQAEAVKYLIKNCYIAELGSMIAGNYNV
jgi:hypothetical protein